MLRLYWPNVTGRNSRFHWNFPLGIGTDTISRARNENRSDFEVSRSPVRQIIDEGARVLTSGLPFGVRLGRVPDSCGSPYCHLTVRLGENWKAARENRSWSTAEAQRPRKQPYCLYRSPCLSKGVRFSGLAMKSAFCPLSKAGTRPNPFAREAT